MGLLLCMRGDMITISVAEVKAIMKAKKFVLFDGRMDLNAIGIRKETQGDSYDDTLCLIYKDLLHNQVIHLFPITTKPGKLYLSNPINKAGTAILAPGQYRKLWKLGKHKGHDALVQVNPCTVIRDNNRDVTRDFDAAKRETGLFGINLHSVDPLEYQTVISNWSAGCQVMPIKYDKDYLIDLVRMQLKVLKSPYVSYTLIEEKDL